jgi:cation transport ATPase
VCFDKTGTLTTGESEVVEFAADDPVCPERVLDAAQALSSASAHGLSRAVRQYACESSGRVLSSECAWPSELRTWPGRGLQGRVAGIEGMVYLGSARWMRELGLECSGPLQGEIRTLLAQGKSFACIGWEGWVRGVFGFREQLREEAVLALEELRDAGLHVSILTGDHAARAAVLEQLLQVEVASELLPEDKAAAVSAVRGRHGPVAMVGDGLNDAPALAFADVGIALGCGADVSREAAQVCLLGNDLRRVGWSMRLASQTLRTVSMNLFWAFAYNVIGIGIAAAGWLNPIWAAGAMVISSLLVVSNSLRLQTWSDHG